jgi:D-arabinose 1-dehydrogenase-like Zn-dependent alcohol dehydrogenase
MSLSIRLSQQKANNPSRFGRRLKPTPGERTPQRRTHIKAAQIVQFGPPSVITNDDLPQPEPGSGQLSVRVKAAGVGNWDALIRKGKVQLQPLPLVLGDELSGIVEGVGPDVSGFTVGDEVRQPQLQLWLSQLGRCFSTTPV